MSAAALARYRSSRVVNNDAPGILLALLDGLERFLSAAHLEYSSQRFAQGFEYVRKSRAITDELLASLDRDRAPELCQSLTSLYSFASRRLTDALIKKDLAALEDAQRTLAPIIDAFRQAVPIARAEAEGVPPKVVAK